MSHDTRPSSLRTLSERMRGLRLVPVVELPSVDDAVPLADALTAADLPCMEITFRTPAALAGLQTVRERFPELLLGAGTVLSAEQLEAAASCGVDFVVSPGLSTELVERGLADGVPVIPGVCTPTEIELARSYGLELLKFFPAEAAGGARLLRALCGPYREISFIPTGGIDASNLLGYLALEQVVACGGSWMVSRGLLRTRDFERIRTLARQAVEIAGKGS